ncbi:MAG: hypothetical protein LBR78_02330 [Holosporales bacterium]|nr:hypothetical protein [Holosporales bacterium]
MMNSKKILLCAVTCMMYCAVCSNDANAEYSGTDPKVDLLEKRLNELQKQLSDAMKETQEKLNSISTKEIQDKIASIVNEIETLKAALDEINKKTEELASKPVVTEEAFNEWKGGLETQLAEMKTTLDELVAKPSVTKEEIETLGVAIQTIASQVASSKDSADLTPINEQLQAISSQLQAMQEQQATEHGKCNAVITEVKGELAKVKAAAEMTKTGKTNLGGIGNVLGAAAGSAIAGLFGGGQTAQQTLTPEEQNRQEAIAAAVKAGKMEPAALQQAQDELNKQITQRLKEETMPKYTFWGVNPKFSDRAVLAHIVLESRAQRRPDAGNLLGEKATPNDQEIINAIYGLVQQGATVNDVLNRVKLVFSGTPRKVITPPPPPQRATQSQAATPPAQFDNQGTQDVAGYNGVGSVDTTWQNTNRWRQADETNSYVGDENNQNQQNWGNQGGNVGGPQRQSGNRSTQQEQQNWGNQGGDIGGPQRQGGNRSNQQGQQNWDNQGSNIGVPQKQGGNRSNQQGQNWDNQGSNIGGPQRQGGTQQGQQSWNNQGGDIGGPQRQGGNHSNQQGQNWDNQGGNVGGPQRQSGNRSNQQSWNNQGGNIGEPQRQGGNRGNQQGQQNWNNQGGDIGGPQRQGGNHSNQQEQQNWDNQGGNVGGSQRQGGNRSNQQGQNWDNQGGNVGPQRQGGNRSNQQRERPRERFYRQQAEGRANGYELQNRNDQGSYNKGTQGRQSKEATMIVSHEGEKTYFEVPTSEFMQIATKVKNPRSVEVDGTEYEPLDEKSRDTLRKYVGKAK